MHCVGVKMKCAVHLLDLIENIAMKNNEESGGKETCGFKLGYCTFT